MSEYISLEISAIDRHGITRLKIDSQFYDEVKERIKKFVDYVYKNEEYASFKISAQLEDGITTEREFKRCNKANALSQIIDFIKYIFNVEDEIESTVYSHQEKDREIPTLPQWISSYELESMTQREKLFLLLKHHHAGEWVRSQDLKVEYESIYGEEIKLSSLSTYLARFYSEGILRRRGSRAQREYFLPPENVNI